MLYADEAGYRLPASYAANHAAGNRYWYELIQPYIKDVSGVWRCPSATLMPTGGAYPAANSYGVNYYYLTCVYPGNPANGSSSTWYNYGGCPLAKIDKPEATILMGDSGAHTVTGGAWSTGMAYVISWAQMPGNYFVYLNHNLNANVGFSDGHVVIKPRNFVTTDWNYRADKP